MLRQTYPSNSIKHRRWLGERLADLYVYGTRMGGENHNAAPTVTKKKKKKKRAETEKSTMIFGRASDEERGGTNETRGK